MSFIHLQRRRPRWTARLMGGLALAASVTAIACSTPQAESGDVRPDAAVPSVRIAHAWGNESSHFTSTLRDALEQAIPGAQIELIDSTAGVTNLSMLQRKQVDAASTYADIAYMASVGQLAGRGRGVRTSSAPSRRCLFASCKSSLRHNRPSDRSGTFAGAAYRSGLRAPAWQSRRACCSTRMASTRPRSRQSISRSTKPFSRS